MGLIGALKAFYIAEGDSVRIRELLAELDNTDQQARVAQSESTVRLSQAELQKLMAGCRAEERRGSDEAAANPSFATTRSSAAHRWPRVGSPRVNPWTRPGRPWARLKPVMRPKQAAVG